MTRLHSYIVFFAALVCLNFAQNVSAVEPSINGILPTGVQRGKETEVTFTGAKLADAQDLLLYSPGVTITGWEAGKDNQVKAKLTVTPDCRLGIHALRMRTATGVSNMMTFMVGALPEVAEVEPNSEFTKPQPITMNVTVTGIIQTEDVDNFEIELKKGDRLVAEIEGLRLGRVAFDPYLAILNSERFELVRSDDLALLHQDCLCAIIAPEDGKYIIQVRETAFGGGGSSYYRLHVGNYPRPTAVYPAGGKPGETINVRWIGDPGGDFQGQVTLPTNAEGDNYGLHAQDARGIAPSPNMVRINYLNSSLEVEPNDEHSQATPAPEAPCAMNGIIDRPNDIDYFKFKAKKGERFEIRVRARKDLRSPLDSVITLMNSKGATIGSNDDTGGPDSYLQMNAPADDEYVVSIRDHLKNGGPNFVYRIEVAPSNPSVLVALPERVQYISTTLSIPKGNRMAFMFSSVRDKWAGDLNLELKDLPPGLSYEAIKMPANRNETIVLFTAAADAQPAGRLVAVSAKPVDDKLNPESRFHQRTMLVRGNQNNEVWGHSADRAPIVVTEQVPFQLQIVQPKAPLLRNGSLDLKVVATRAPDFKAPIAVSMAYNPPGIGASVSAVIPEGQNETTIPMTCNANAETLAWKIVVLGRAPFGNGTVEAASPFADLVIADQFYNFAFQKAACELGQETTLAVKIEKKTDFAGEAKAELLGLPIETSSMPLTFKSDTEELLFKVKVNPTAKPGKYTQIVCRTSFELNGETVYTTLGPAELRVDTPLPVKAQTAAAKPGAPAAAGPAKPADGKPLSRLEQLRLDKEQQGKK